jgi:hypothetical protein
MENKKNQHGKSWEIIRHKLVSNSQEKRSDSPEKNKLIKKSSYVFSRDVANYSQNHVDV